MTALLSALNSGGTLRLIVTPDDAATAATYTGYTNTTYPGPTLELNAVPEPGAIALVSLAAMGLITARCRRGM